MLQKDILLFLAHIFWLGISYLGLYSENLILFVTYE
jgi:hypothetical protein